MSESAQRGKVEAVADVEQLEQMLSDPCGQVEAAMGRLSGDLMVLGVGGKMGPSLARMAVRASEAAGASRQVIGVARFTDPAVKERLASWGVKTIAGDLLDGSFVRKLPDAPNVVFMAGMKFGSTGQESLTWAMNTWLPGIICQRFAGSRIAAFSTGNVYGMTPVVRGGSREADPPNPQGEYAMSCLGRERVLAHFSRTQRTPVSVIRLNYAVELRYGVLVDLAQQVWAGQPIDLSMGNMNVIWQRDANAMALASLAYADSPPFVLNVAGPELLSVRQVCQRFGQLMKKPVEFVGSESAEALLNNGQKGHHLFGYPQVSADQMMQWIARWIEQGGATLNKPTHFEVRDGKF